MVHSHEFNTAINLTFLLASKCGAKLCQRWTLTLKVDLKCFQIRLQSTFPLFKPSSAPICANISVMSYKPWPYANVPGHTGGCWSHRLHLGGQEGLGGAVQDHLHPRPEQGHEQPQRQHLHRGQLWCTVWVLFDIILSRVSCPHTQTSSDSTSPARARWPSKWRHCFR